ncbi:PilN domain-containing protein [Pantoea sp. FN060301]|uniref:PilN domain-containing protein n=1 Tax=Pantoea sp. FN060301 TaxID=3420380 RepID=UPI003D166240
MVWVNFLPWRHRQRLAQRTRALLLPALLALLPASVLLQATGQRAVNAQNLHIVAGWQGATQQLSTLQARAAALTRQKQQLQQAIAARKAQQQKMLEWYLFARDLAEQMPETLWLSEISQNAAGLSLKGFSKGMREMHDFRQRLQSVRLFRGVKTEKVSLDEQYGIRFSLAGAVQSGEGADE